MHNTADTILHGIDIQRTGDENRVFRKDNNAVSVVIIFSNRNKVYVFEVELLHKLTFHIFLTGRMGLKLLYAQDIRRHVPDDFCYLGARTLAGRGGIGIIEHLDIVAHDPQGRTVARAAGRLPDTEPEMLVDSRPSDQDGKKRNQRERWLPEQSDE